RSVLRLDHTAEKIFGGELAKALDTELCRYNKEDDAIVATATPQRPGGSGVQLGETLARSQEKLVSSVFDGRATQLNEKLISHMDRQSAHMEHVSANLSAQSQLLMKLADRLSQG
ncbi:MAG: hypothetical protein MHM6MM_006731, partial [Cercozoa sp. M6MM]